MEGDMTPTDEALVAAYYPFAALQMLKEERRVVELGPVGVTISSDEIAQRAQELVSATAGSDAEAVDARKRVDEAFKRYIVSKGGADAVIASLERNS